MNTDGTKTIRRLDLQHDESSSEPPSQIEALYLQRIGADFESPLIAAKVASIDALSRDEEAEAEAFDFRLFSKKGISGAAAGDLPSRVELRSTSPDNEAPGFVIPHKSHDYYFSIEATGDQQKRFLQSAVSGQDIMNHSKTRWKGCELPWRVTVIRSSAPSHGEGAQLEAGERAKDGKTRPGKKRRIILRQRKADELARRVSSEQIQAEREEAEKQKRNKKNRERKIKRRQKERDKKTAHATVAE